MDTASPTTISLQHCTPKVNVGVPVVGSISPPPPSLPLTCTLMSSHCMQGAECCVHCLELPGAALAAEKDSQDF